MRGPHAGQSPVLPDKTTSKEGRKEEEEQDDAGREKRNENEEGERERLNAAFTRTLSLAPRRRCDLVVGC